MIIHVFGEVQGPTSTGDLHDEYLKNILNVPITKLLTARGLHSKCLFSGPLRFQGTCDMTLHLDGVHICHTLKYWLRRLHRYSLSAKNEIKIWVKMVYLEGICMVKADRYVVR